MKNDKGMVSFAGKYLAGKKNVWLRRWCCRRNNGGIKNLQLKKNGKAFKTTGDKEDEVRYRCPERSKSKENFGIR